MLEVGARKLDRGARRLDPCARMRDRRDSKPHDGTSDHTTRSRERGERASRRHECPRELDDRAREHQSRDFKLVMRPRKAVACASKHQSCARKPEERVRKRRARDRKDRSRTREDHAPAQAHEPKLMREIQKSRYPERGVTATHLVRTERSRRPRGSREDSGLTEEGVPPRLAVARPLGAARPKAVRG